jgi:para-nitrobenzyl esterase
MSSAVSTTHGQVRGQRSDGVTRFLGIPYAASPTGALRFRAPAPPPAWEGILDANAFSATPPKPDYAAPFDVLLAEPNIPGDDWLTVNVWTPGGSGLPVMVWIHGGAFSNGNSAIPMYDGHTFARDGVVLVTINYRLGVDGFGYLPDAPANRGLLDQIAALEWVRDNIAAFGGDPGNVTIFGESAGAMSITTLLSIPRARGLFAKAITQSGAAQAAADPADAALVTGELGLALGLTATASNLAEIPVEKLVEAQATVRNALAAHPDPARFGATIAASLMAFVPVIDGDLIPAHPMAAIAAGAGAEVPLLTGTTSEEYRLFLFPTGLGALITDDVLAGLLPALGAGAPVAGLYRSNRPGATPGDILAALITDKFFRLPALAVAEARTSGAAPTYVYEFAWRSPVGDLGACHSLEIPFVFDNLSASGAGLVLGEDRPQDLASQMHTAWIRFARDGDPGWRAFDKDYPIRIFRDAGPAAEAVELDPRGDERTIWSNPIPEVA